MTRLSRLSASFDVKRLLEVERASFADPWTVGMFAAELSFANCEMIGAFEVEANERETDTDEVDSNRVYGRKMQGFVSFARVMDEGEVRNLAVLPELRRRGIASLLLNAVEQRARELNVTTLFLEVRAGNQAAVSLYESRGYTAVGRRRGYYRKPREDAVIMRLEVV
jgi:ribosomal-protein-alanine acetyltransferase